MDRITKVLRLLSRREQDRVHKVISDILTRKLNALDLKKLKGVENVYRVRTGSVRIIFRKKHGMNDIEVLDVCRRDEDTYRNL